MESQREGDHLRSNYAGSLGPCLHTPRLGAYRSKCYIYCGIPSPFFTGFIRMLHVVIRSFPFNSCPPSLPQDCSEFSAFSEGFGFLSHLRFSIYRNCGLVSLAAKSPLRQVSHFWGTSVRAIDKRGLTRQPPILTAAFFCFLTYLTARSCWLRNSHLVVFFVQLL